MEDNPLNPVTRNHAIPIIYVAKGESKERGKKKALVSASITKHFLEMWEHVMTVIIVALIMAHRRPFGEKWETDCSKGDRSIDPNLKCLTGADNIPTDEQFSSVTQPSQTHRSVITGCPGDQTDPRYRGMVRAEIVPRHALRRGENKINYFSFSRPLREAQWLKR